MSIDFQCYTYNPEQRLYMFVDDAPTVNMGNATAASVMGVLGLPMDDPCGSVPPSAVPELRRKLASAIRKNDERQLFTIPASESRAVPTLSVVAGNTLRTVRNGRCAFIDAGVPDERLRRRLQSLEPVLAYAEEHELHFGWG